MGKNTDLGGCVVVVVSLPMLALPLSEEALQLPELECGCSSVLPAFRLSRLWAALSRNLTELPRGSGTDTGTGRLETLLPLELDELGFLSCDRDLLSLSRLFRLDAVPVDSSLAPGLSCCWGSGVSQERPGSEECVEPGEATSTTAE